MIMILPRLQRPARLLSHEHGARECVFTCQKARTCALAWWLCAQQHGSLPLCEGLACSKGSTDGCC